MHWLIVHVVVCEESWEEAESLCPEPAAEVLPVPQNTQLCTHEPASNSPEVSLAHALPPGGHPQSPRRTIYASALVDPLDPEDINYYILNIKKYTGRQARGKSERLLPVVEGRPLLTESHGDRKSTRLNSSHIPLSRMPSSA